MGGRTNRLTWLVAGVLTAGTSGVATGDTTDLTATLLSNGGKGAFPESTIVELHTPSWSTSALGYLAVGSPATWGPMESFYFEPVARDLSEPGDPSAKPAVRLPEPSTLLLVLAGSALAWHSRRKLL